MSSTLLLADDSLTIQKVVELTFADTDFQVVAVSSGEELLRRIPECRPDVIICDVIMPGKDGYQVCQEVKSNPDSLHIPVILLTGTFEPFDRDRALAAGCSEVITKPFEARKLVETVERLVASEPEPAEPEGAPPWAAEGGFQPLDSYGGDDDLDFGTRLSVPSPVLGDEVPAETGESFGAPDELPPVAVEPSAPVDEAPPESADFDQVEVGDTDLDEAPLAADLDQEDFAFGTAPDSELPPPLEADPGDDLAELDAAEASAAEEWAPVAVAEDDHSAAAEDLADVGAEDDQPELPAGPEPPEFGGGYAVVDALEEHDEPFDAGEPTERSDAETGPVVVPGAAAAAREETEPSPATLSPAPAAGELSDGDIDRIARRVLELAAGTVERVAWEVIPDMAEVVVRERIRQLEAEVEGRGADEIQ